MAEKVSQSLDGVSKTLLMTLYVRACESRRPDAMIMDVGAVRMVEQLDCDFSHLKMHRHDEIAVIMRLRKFDRYVREFLALHPDGVVVHIGCGLDTRFERVDNSTVIWFDLDMPDVVKLRQILIRNECDRYHLLAASVFEDGWMVEVSSFKPRPFLFLAEGVFPYFEEALIKTLFLKLRDYFPGCEMVCDAHTPFVV